MLKGMTIYLKNVIIVDWFLVKFTFCDFSDIMGQKWNQTKVSDKGIIQRYQTKVSDKTNGSGNIMRCSTRYCVLIPHGRQVLPDE